MHKISSQTKLELESLFTSLDGTLFSCSEFRDLYEEQFGLGPCSTSSELRKWLYRRLLTHVRKGRIEKTFVEGKPRFMVTSMSSEASERIQVTELQTDCLDLKLILRRTLNQYKVDIIANSSECEEYKRLLVEYPHLAKDIEPLLKAQSEHASELLGKAKAVSRILKLESV